jgi:3-isopropylmalate dehydratase small subunit
LIENEEVNTMTDEPTVLKGRIWLITDEKGYLGDDIDTDMIYHNAHLAITDINQMGQYAFGNLKGWENFSKEARTGDLVMAGRNFGAGSSRQQAVDCFVSLGIGALICESYGAIYKRNAINSGFPIVIVPNLVSKLKDNNSIKHLQEVELDLESGGLLDAASGNTLIEGNPFSEVQFDLYRSGGLLKFNPKKV